MSDASGRDGRNVPFCHRLPALVKIGLALAVIVCGIATPAEHWPLFGVLGCVVFAGHSLAGVPLAYLIRRLLIFLPFILMMAVSLPLSQGFRQGWDLMLTIVGRGTVAFLTSLWLVNVMPFEQLLRTLRTLHVPVTFVAILAFMYRYVFVVWNELDRLRTARTARSMGRTSLWFRWKSLASLLATLLIRSLTRAERIHGAMLSRGWTGEFHWLDSE